MAQKISTDDIIGVYSLPTNNPEGGQSFAVFPDNTFVSVYFGGLIKGSWSTDGMEVHFTIITESKIAVYGRKLEALKDTIQLDFSGDFNRRAKVNLNVETESEMQHIFNEGANCKGYPYIYKTVERPRKIAFAVSDGIRNEESQNFEIVTFEIPEIYNDFIAINLPEQYTTENKFVVNYKNGDLYFNSESEPTSKRPLSSISEEDKGFYKQITEGLLPDILSYGNELFPYIENPTQENVQSFYLIEPISINTIKEQDIKVKPTSMYTARCD